jgi:hypothetical protein
MILTLFPLDLSRYSAAVQKSWMTDDLLNKGSNGINPSEDAARRRLFFRQRKKSVE